MRLAVLTTHPIQYQAPVFRELAKQPGLELKVFFGCDQGVRPVEDANFKTVFQWDCDLLSGYNYEFFSNKPLLNICGLPGLPLAIKAFRKIKAYKPDVILFFSYTPLFITVSTLLLSSFGFRIFLRAETTDVAIERFWLKSLLRKCVLTTYYKFIHHFFPLGTNSIEHYLTMGIQKEQLTPVPYAVDVDFFQNQVLHWLPQREQLREALCIKKDAHVFIYCGKMFWPKNPLLIPKALSLLSDADKKRIWLLAVGDGELREQFERLAKEQLGERSLFVGFKNQSELGEYYAIADTLILPSQSGETWGLVVNEALQFGLRAIVSSKTGCAVDLVNSIDRGLIFSSGNALDLSKCISEIINSPQKSSCTLADLPHPKHFVQALYERILEE